MQALLFFIIVPSLGFWSSQLFTFTFSSDRIAMLNCDNKKLVMYKDDLSSYTRLVVVDGTTFLTFSYFSYLPEFSLGLYTIRTTSNNKTYTF